MVNNILLSDIFLMTDFINFKIKLAQGMFGTFKVFLLLKKSNQTTLLFFNSFRKVALL
jgi:hypothetical protein